MKNKKAYLEKIRSLRRIRVRMSGSEYLCRLTFCDDLFSSHGLHINLVHKTSKLSDSDLVRKITSLNSSLSRKTGSNDWKLILIELLLQNSESRFTTSKNAHISTIQLLLDRRFLVYDPNYNWIVNRMKIMSYK